MCFVQSRRHGLVPKRNTKAYFLRNNAGCYQLCNNHRLPVRSQSMAVKIMRINSVAHRLLRELIADCLGHRFETHVRSFINKAMLSNIPLNYQPTRFPWKNCGCARSLNRCSQWLSSPFGGVARSHARAAREKKTQVVRMREVLEVVGWCMCAPCFRLVLLNLLAHRSG